MQLKSRACLSPVGFDELSNVVFVRIWWGKQRFAGWAVAHREMISSDILAGRSKVRQGVVSSTSSSFWRVGILIEGW
jgi:hypothetical protein